MKDTKHAAVAVISFVIGFICVMSGATLQSTAAAYAGILHFIICGYCYGIVVFRSAVDDPFPEALDKLEKAEQLAAGWKQEAQRIWSHISDESPVARGTISNTIRATIIRRDHHTCTYCGEKGSETADAKGKSWHIDHVQPVSRGGYTVPGNLVLACSGCNLNKSMKSGAEYIRQKYHSLRNRRRPVYTDPPATD